MADLPPYRHGPWITTFTGRQFDFSDPQPDQIHFDDIAISLSRTMRFRGFTEHPYSVAQHSFLVSKLVPEEDALWGLLHDAAEAYMGDMPKPLKYHMGSEFQAIEERIMRVIAEVFNLCWPEPLSIRQVDRQMMVTEADRLMKHQSEDWHLAYGYKPDPEIPLMPYSISGARIIFTKRYYEILEAR